MEKKIFKYKVSDRVVAIKGQDVIIGVISEVIPEMQYEITEDSGKLRTVDHSHIYCISYTKAQIQQALFESNCLGTDLHVNEAFNKLFPNDNDKTAIL